MGNEGVQSKGPPEKSVPSKSKASSARTLGRSNQPNIVAVFAVFFVCIGVSVVILISSDLRNSRLGEVLAGLMMALSISVVLFSIVSSTAPVRLSVGLGGAALFYFLIWPQIEKAIHPPPEIHAIRGSIYFITNEKDLGLRPVQGAEIRVPNTSLKSSQATGETGDFMIDAPSDIEELEVSYRGRIYPFKLSKSPATARYQVIPLFALQGDAAQDSRLRNVYVVDATLEISGPHWDRIVDRMGDSAINAPSIGGTARARTCAPEWNGYVVDDTRPDFPGGFRISNSGGTGNHRESSDSHCVALYVDGAGSSAWLRGIEVALKKLVSGGCGRVETVGTKLLYAGITQVALDSNRALGPCVGPDLPALPEWKTTVVFKREDGSVIDIVDLNGFQLQHTTFELADLWMNASGVLSIAVKQD